MSNWDSWEIKDKMPNLMEENLRRLNQKCEQCKVRFKCYTQNTAERPEQLKGINFEVAKCCIRCTNSNFRRGKDRYRKVGKCGLYGVAIHQLSYCEKFNPKRSDNLTYEVYEEIKSELELTMPNYGLPRYCIVDQKHIIIDQKGV